VLQVVYWEGKVGKGKIDAFDACSADARKRDELVQRREQFLQALPEEEKQLLQVLSAERRDDSKGEVPGSERGDAEEKLFVMSLPEEERHFLEGHKGLGNSQKAEIAWLEKCGYAYEEIDVRNFKLA
jgi:hypothetical protein